MRARISATVLTRFWRSAVPLGLAALALIVASDLSAQTSTGRASTMAAPLPPLTVIDITSDRNAPQAPGMPIMFTATANERTGSVHYQWLVFTHGWHVAQAWSPSGSFVWTPTTASASYRIGVWARYAGSTADGPDSAQARSILAFPIVASDPAGVDAAIVAADQAGAGGALALPELAWIPDGDLDVTLTGAVSPSSGETATTVVPASPGATVTVEPAAEPVLDAVDALANDQTSGAPALPELAWIPDGDLDVTLTGAVSPSSGGTATTVVGVSSGANVATEPATEPEPSAVQAGTGDAANASPVLVANVPAVAGDPLPPGTGDAASASPAASMGLSGAGVSPVVEVSSPPNITVMEPATELVLEVADANDYNANTPAPAVVTDPAVALDPLPLDSGDAATSSPAVSLAVTAAGAEPASPATSATSPEDQNTASGAPAPPSAGGTSAVPVSAVRELVHSVDDIEYLVAQLAPATTSQVNHPGRPGDARDAGSNVKSPMPPDTSETASAEATPASSDASPLRVVHLTADRTAPQAPGTPITFTATTAGGTGQAQLEWWVFTDDWHVVQAWSASPSFIWTPTTASADYRIGVRAREATGTIDTGENDQAIDSLAFPIAGGF